MPIVVEHQPVEAIGQLALKAGGAQYDKERRDQRDREQLVNLQAGHRQSQLAFMAKAQEEARAEEFNYQTQLNMQKRDIDMQLDLSNYAREKQRLQQTLNMINQSEDLNDSEKEELAIQATASYAGVGTGITPASFNASGSKALQNHILLGSFKTAQAKEIQDALDAGDINLYQANQQAATLGLQGIEFKDPKMQMEAQMDSLLERVKKTRDTYAKSFFTDKKGRPFDAVTEEPIPKDSPKYEEWKAMKREMQESIETLTGARGQAADLQEYIKFNNRLEWDTELKDLADRIGSAKAFQEWMKKQPKSSTYEEPEEEGFVKQMKRHPIMDTMLSNLPGGAGNLYFGATRGGELLKKGVKQAIDPDSDINKYLRSKGLGDE